MPSPKEEDSFTDEGFPLPATDISPDSTANGGGRWRDAQEKGWPPPAHAMMEREGEHELRDDLELDYEGKVFVLRFDEVSSLALSSAARSAKSLSRPGCCCCQARLGLVRHLACTGYMCVCCSASAPVLLSFEGCQCGLGFTNLFEETRESQTPLILASRSSPTA